MVLGHNVRLSRRNSAFLWGQRYRDVAAMQAQNNPLLLVSLPFQERSSDFLKHFLTFEQSAILKSKTFNETTYSFVELEALWNDKGDDEKQNYVPLQIPLFSITSVVYGKEDDKTIGFLIES